MTDIPRLIEELEAATEGSIGLDVQVLHACGFGNSELYPRNGYGDWIAPTRSVDDALVLMRSHALGWEGELSFLASGRGFTDARGPEFCDADQHQIVSSKITTLPLSICIALLRTLDLTARKEAA